MRIATPDAAHWGLRLGLVRQDFPAVEYGGKRAPIHWHAWALVDWILFIHVLGLSVLALSADEDGLPVRAAVGIQPRG